MMIGKNFVLHYILFTTVPLAFKTAVYYGVFRFRNIEATLLDCIIIAGIPIFLSVLPIPIPLIPIPIIVIG